MYRRENYTHRIYSALEIPMNPDESVNEENLRRLVEYELSQGVEGFYCSGSSGEALLLTLEEREKSAGNPSGSGERKGAGDSADWNHPAQRT